jgi:hypothetical protein
MTTNDKIVRKAQTGETGNKGEFGTHDRTADAIVLNAAPAAGAKVTPGDAFLEPGDEDYLDAGGLGYDDLPPVGLRRSEEGGGYFVAPTVPVPLMDWAPTDLNDDQKVAWVDAHQDVINTFLRDRYGAILTGLNTLDDGVERIERAGAEVMIWADEDRDGGISHQDISDAVGRSNAPTMMNEFDDGSWNSVNASRLVREYISSRAIASSSDDMTPADIDREVRARVGKREIRPETARAIAKRLAYEVWDGIVDVPDAVPALDDLAYGGHADKEKLMSDLRTIYAKDTRPQSRARIDMMMTWVLHGSPVSEAV